MILLLLLSIYFNSHPRVGGDSAAKAKEERRDNFNSHPRVGGDMQGRECLQRPEISIRTPAWGVTSEGVRKSLSAYFNSHPRVGGDFDIDKKIRDVTISIRTPAWGVTTNSPTHVTEEVFQFAPPRGG